MESSSESNYFYSNFVGFLVLFSKALIAQVTVMESGLDRLLMKYCIILVFLYARTCSVLNFFDLQGLLELVWLE